MLLFDTTTQIAVGAAISSLALAIVLAIVLVVLLLRTRPQAAQGENLDLDRMLRDSDARFEQMLDDLSGQLVRAREDLRRSNRLSGLAASIDLDAVAERVLEAALELPEVDAAAILVPRPSEEPLLATAGMTRAEAELQPLPAAPDGPTRAVAVAYRYAADDGEAASDRVRGGVAVPLQGREEHLGTLAVFWRRDRQAGDAELAALEELAGVAAPAVENALRYRDASRLADLDALTSLHNRRFFHETLARECSRAERYERRLSLLIFDVDDFKAINDRIGHLAGDSVLADLAERVRSVVRTSDIACRVGGDEFAVILPESGLSEAQQLYQRLQFAVGNAATGPVDRVWISGGIAELREGDDPATLFERADEALYRAKQSGKGHAAAANDGVH
ncbi:MAG TPA: diguanylate cyclase [Gaiellaceae bacterium]